MGALGRSTDLGIGRFNSSSSANGAGSANVATRPQTVDILIPFKSITKSDQSSKKFSHLAGLNVSLQTNASFLI